MVSHAARVGAMTITRPVGGSAAMKASWSGGKYRSWMEASMSEVFFFEI
jgi:hypothetical protein